MKKVIAFCMALCLCMGCQKSNEDKVIEAFKEYASMNFDDPNSLKEIVSVDSVDTFSTIIIKEYIGEIYHKYDSIGKVRKQKGDDFIAFMKDKKKTSQLPRGMANSNQKFKSLIFRYFQMLENDVSLAKLSDDAARKGDFSNVYDMEGDYNDIMKRKDTVFCAQSISYRIQDKSGLKLHRIHVTCDTLYSSFHFGDEIPDEYSQLMSDFDYFSEKYKRDFDINIEKINLLDGMFSILKDEYNVVVSEH